MVGTMYENTVILIYSFSSSYNKLLWTWSQNTSLVPPTYPLSIFTTTTLIQGKILIINDR